MSETKTVSLAGSKNVTWELVDKHAEKLGLDRSTYIQQLVEQDIYPKKYKKIRSLTDIIIILLCFVIIILLIAVI